MSSENKANPCLLPTELILDIIEKCPINCLPILEKVDSTCSVCAGEVSRKLISRYLDGDPELKDHYKVFGDKYFRNRAMDAYLNTKHNTNMRCKQISENCKENVDLLLRVTKAGFQEVASVLVARGIRIRDCTSLFRAKSDKEMTILLEAGADSKASSQKRYMNSLHFASQRGYVHAVQTLLSHRCFIEQRAVYQYTALHYAAKEGHMDVVQLLLNQGANMEALASEQQTPLHLACLYAHIDVVLLLITHQANIKAMDCHGQTALHYVCHSEGRKHVRVNTNNNNNIGAKNKVPNSTFEYTCKLRPFRRLALVKILLAHGANVEERNLELVTPLLYASKAGYTDIVLLLLEHNANVDAIDIFGCTALHHASKEGHEEIVKLLLNHGANCLLADIYDNLALNYACQVGHSGVVTLLLKCSKNINTKNIHGCSALRTAIANQHPEIVSLFLLHRLESAVKNKLDLTTLTFGTRYGCEEVIKLLSEMVKRV